MQSSSGLLFEARNLNLEETTIAEKDYLSIIQKCENKTDSKIDPGTICDAFMGYYINQCDKLDNLLSYCDIKIPDEILSLNPLLSYELDRSAQQECLKQPNVILETRVCEDYVNIPGMSEKRFKFFDSTKPHVHIPSAKVYTNIYTPKIFGEVINNFSYPIEYVQIFARIDDVNSNTSIYKHTYTEDNYLKPGQKSGFYLLLEDPVSEKSVYYLTSVFQNATDLLPEKLQLIVDDPNYDSRKDQTIQLPNDTSENTKTKSEPKMNLSKETLSSAANIKVNATGTAMNEAQDILGTAANATADATGALMNRADNVLSLASDAASNATKAAMENTMNMLANVSNQSPSNVEREMAINEEANKLIDAVADTSVTIPVTGKITNLGNVTATSVRLSGIFYDLNHEVVDTNSNFINLEKGILPGQQVPFDLTPILNYENEDKIVSYELNVESSEYSMIRK